MRTDICDRLGIEFPIFAFSHCRDVVVAVSRAGGFGVLGATKKTPDELDLDLRLIEEEIGGRPYGVDVLIPTVDPAAQGADQELADLEGLIPAGHRQFVNDLLDRYGVPAIPDDEDGYGFSKHILANGAMTLADVALAHDVRLIASGLGPPPPALVEAAHAKDVVVAALVGSRVHAERQQASGVDLIVAQGYEAGGHTGEVATMVLVPEVVDAVAPLPVLAAGGIASGRQMAAAMALGAQGVWTGTVWTVTEEAETHPVVKDKLLAATSSDTLRSKAWSGKPCRLLRSPWTDAWADPANPEPLRLPMHTMLIEEAWRRIDRAARAGNPGAKELINQPIGQVIGHLGQVRPAARVLLEMVEEYVEVTEKLAAGLQRV